MGQAHDFIDPWGAPEIFIEGIAWREMVGADLVRSFMFARERGERIIRVKILIPFASCATEHQHLHDFINMQEAAARCGRMMAS